MDRVPASAHPTVCNQLKQGLNLFMLGLYPGSTEKTRIQAEYSVVGTPRLASASACSLPGSPACPLTHFHDTSWRATRSSSNCQRSAFLTGFLAAVRHPRRFQSGSHFVMALRTYCESVWMVTL